jgi:hypothetical protein
MLKVTQMEPVNSNLSSPSSLTSTNKEILRKGRTVLKTMLTRDISKISKDFEENEYSSFLSIITLSIYRVIFLNI